MNILCNNLGKDASFGQLLEVAGLIYDTDPYIYPAMFESRAEAQNVISKMICEQDVMFNYNNIFVAERDESIIGMILWHRGSLSWNKDIYIKCGGHSPHINYVIDKYFSSYQNVNSDTVSLINVCTSIRKSGVGEQMLRCFFETVSGPYELYVLTDNTTAINLYQKMGFKTSILQKGFSIDSDDVHCYKMEKN